MNSFYAMLVIIEVINLSKKLSEREKCLIVKYAYLIDRYLHSRRESPQAMDEHYFSAAYGLVCGVCDVDKAAAGKSFTDDTDREAYYANFLYLCIRNHVIDSINAGRAWSRGGRAIHISTADTLSPSESQESGTIEDMLADSISADSFKAIEDKECVQTILQRCTPHQQMICRYIAYGYKCSEIAEQMNVTTRHIYRELGKIRNSSMDILPRSNKRTANNSETNHILTEKGRMRVQLCINGKQYRTGFIPPNEVNAVRDELLALRDKDPEAAVRRIGEINAEIRSKKQYKNPRYIRVYKNFYTVRLTIDKAEERVGMIPTLSEAIAVRDELIQSKKSGNDDFYATLNGFRKKYGGKK